MKLIRPELTLIIVETNALLRVRVPPLRIASLSRNVFLERIDASLQPASRWTDSRNHNQSSEFSRRLPAAIVAIVTPSTQLSANREIDKFRSIGRMEKLDEQREESLDNFAKP